jgi:CPA2 family monovalent cation:H+ antiporter-2
MSVTALAAIAGLRVRRAQLGVGLGQIGEFSFVVLGLGVAAGAITSGVFSAALAAAVVSIALSAIAVRLFPRSPAASRASSD